MVRLQRSVAGVLPDAVELWVKVEGANPGGSVKDRAALAMILDAERRGALRPGATLLDAGSGNTGIAEAMIAAERGYRLVLCLPTNANAERKTILAAYGAEVVLTSALEGSDGAIRAARALAAAHPDWVHLDQYSNTWNWKAHEGSTGPEIWADSSGRITHFVATVGTSGTLMGVARHLKQQRAGVIAVEVQPDGPFHGLYGAKYMAAAILPPIYDPNLADERRFASTEAAYGWVRRLARDEGLLIGPSGGAAVDQAVAVGQTLTAGYIVAILPDSGERYLSESHLWGTLP